MSAAKMEAFSMRLFHMVPSMMENERRKDSARLVEILLASDDIDHKQFWKYKGSYQMNPTGINDNVRTKL